jgi:ribosomal-protein-alanine acetyltransferase
VNYAALAAEAAFAIAPMQAADVEDVARLEAAATEFPWLPGNFSDSLQAGHWCWVVRQQGEIAAFAIVLPAVDSADLLNIAVAPERQRQGIGVRLLRHVLCQLEAQGLPMLFLEVRQSNQPAIALYQHLGFRQVGLRRGYYPARQGREDALVMRREAV